MAMFRNTRDVLMLAGMLVFSGILLLAVMSLLDIRWNFLNLAAAPLLLGEGIDYGIHIIFAMRRLPQHPAATRVAGKAIVICSLTTCVGFGSLCFSSTAALASFGFVAAAGVAACALTAVVALPAWGRQRK